MKKNAVNMEPGKMQEKLIDVLKKFIKAWDNRTMDDEDELKELDKQCVDCLDRGMDESEFPLGFSVSLQAYNIVNGLVSLLEQEK